MLLCVDVVDYRALLSVLPLVDVVAVVVCCVLLSVFLWSIAADVTVVSSRVAVDVVVVC